MAKKKYADKLIGLKCVLKDAKAHNDRNYYTTFNKKNAAEKNKKAGKFTIMKFCSTHRMMTKHEAVKISGK